MRRLSNTVVVRRLISGGCDTPQALLEQSPLPPAQTRAALSELIRNGLAVREVSLRLTGAKPGRPSLKARATWKPNRATKLTAEQAKAIRADKRFCRVVAADYGIHPGTVSKVRRGAIWGDA